MVTVNVLGLPGRERQTDPLPDGFAEAFGVSHRFTTAETWEDLDRDHARVLIDEGLAHVRQQHVDTGVEDPIEPAEPEHRVHYSMIGLSGLHPTFERVREYIFSRAAYQRLERSTSSTSRSG